ncbi:DNA methyltransferase [Nocardia nova]|uniref:HsdM family class I SAM-dependent methyltransferase n=1 Tax=Nocardia nova TaxID=37330 RepID=UPI000CEA62A6|nr:DNA methyltransferase [Nocardia nova]
MIDHPAGNFYQSAGPRDDELADLLKEVRSYRQELGHAGMSMLEFVEQFSYLLFMKLAAEQRDADLSDDSGPHYAAQLWDRLQDKDGEELETQYRHALGELAKTEGTTGAVYARAQNRIAEPAMLKKLVTDLLGPRRVWQGQRSEVLGGLYEELLQDAAGENIEAGNFLTPRPLIDAIVRVMAPRPDDEIVDPACGSAGFLIAAYQHILTHEGKSMGKEELAKLSTGLIRGVEVKDRRAGIATMNMLLHRLGSVSDAGDALVTVDDALATKPGYRPSLVMVNPPFTRRSRGQDSDGAGEAENKSYVRNDFVTTTTSTHLNFVQHVMSILDIGGRAAIVVPDNVLFQAGAGEKIRRRLLRDFEVHTLLRLPTGIFYKTGVKANVLFFDKHSPHADGTPWTTDLWIYDFRTGQHFTGKSKPLQRADLDDFVAQFKSNDRNERTESACFKKFPYEELITRDKANLDITNLGDDGGDADQGLSPSVIAREIAEELQAAYGEFMAIADGSDYAD